jgi:hypothetical protein
MTTAPRSDTSASGTSEPHAPALPPGATPAPHLDERALAALLARLSLPATVPDAPAATLRAIPERDLLAAWEDTVEAFLHPSSPERRTLDPALRSAASLSQAGLDQSLSALLGGFVGHPLHELARRAASHPAELRREPGPIVVILPAEPLGLVVQTLLPALLARRPVLCKTATREPWFTPAFTAALARRLPALAPAVAVVTWPGGEAASERLALDAAGVVVAYGGAAAVRQLARRVPVDRLVVFGPKLSVAILGEDAELAATARGFARDVALFDQHGCLALQAVWVVAPASEPTVDAAHQRAARFARHLAEALAEQPPPGPAALEALAGQRQVEMEATLRGLAFDWVAPGRPAHGLVVVDPEPRLAPSPGGRTVRLHPVARLADVAGALAPWRGQLQGVGLGGTSTWPLVPALRELGASWLAEPGQLQCPDALWNNGDVDLLRRL